MRNTISLICIQSESLAPEKDKRRWKLRSSKKRWRNVDAMAELNFLMWVIAKSFERPTPWTDVWELCLSVASQLPLNPQRTIGRFGSDFQMDIPSKNAETRETIGSTTNCTRHSDCKVIIHKIIVSVVVVIILFLIFFFFFFFFWLRGEWMS